MAKQAHASMSYCLHTLPGLEDVAWLEIRQRFPNASFTSYAYAQDEYGCVVFQTSEPAQALYELRTAERLLATVLWLPKISRGRRDLRETRETLMKSGELGRLFNLLGRLKHRHLHSYQVVGRKYGKHEYSQRDWSMMVRGVIAELYPEWRGTADSADVQVWATIFGSQALIGVRLPKPASQPTPYPPALIAALVRLTEPAAKDVFLDPVGADGGMILTERLATGDVEQLLGVKGGSARRLGHLDPSIALHRWQEERLPIASATVDKMASILPADDAAISQYPTILNEITRLLRPGGYAALFCHKYNRVRELLRRNDDVRILHGYSVRLEGEWGRIYLVERIAPSSSTAPTM